MINERDLRQIKKDLEAIRHSQDEEEVSSICGEAFLQRIFDLVNDFDKTYEALKRIADPEDGCNDGASGPWNDLAQKTLGFKIEDGGDWYNSDGQRRTIEEMIKFFPIEK